MKIPKELKHTFRLVYTIKNLTEDGLLKDVNSDVYPYIDYDYYNSPEECLEAMKKNNDCRERLILPMVKVNCEYSNIK